MEIGKDKIGTYPLQIIIENIITPQEKNILLEGLRNNVIEMSLVNINF